MRVENVCFYSDYNFEIFLCLINETNAGKGGHLEVGSGRSKFGF